MEGEPLGDEAILLGVVGRLKSNTKSWKLMNTQYPTSYADFRHHAKILITNDKLIIQLLGEQSSDKVKKPEQKTQNAYKKPGTQYKGPRTSIFVYPGSETCNLIFWYVQFLRRMAQPYDKTGALGKKTLLSQEDLEKIVNGVGDMLFW